MQSTQMPGGLIRSEASDVVHDLELKSSSAGRGEVAFRGLGRHRQVFSCASCGAIFCTPMPAEKWGPTSTG